MERLLMLGMLAGCGFDASLSGDGGGSDAAASADPAVVVADGPMGAPARLLLHLQTGSSRP